MSEKKILVIDDSATIRKLVDSHLSAAGYNVNLAPTAEDGLEMAADIRPDLILLDHQLPGTTGFEVARQLSETEGLVHIPVVISSTLRKKAYVEYADLDNVVDMLPKPYTEDLLVTTVANAIETAEMVVASQSKGSAVPEVIGETGDPDLSGTFASIQLRELIDFLNNGEKSGVLEVEAERLRLWIYLDGGRLQGVSAFGLAAEEIDRIVSLLPESLSNLSEVLKLTIAGRGSAEFDSFSKLLDRRVLDPRLTTKLLRFQASMLMGMLFSRKLISFQFRASTGSAGWHHNLPLDMSLLALLVEHALHCGDDDLPEDEPNQVYVRRAIRGQNLDRNGLSAHHMKVLNLLSEPATIDQLAGRVDWPRDEIRRVLFGFVQAGILQRRADNSKGHFVVYEPSAVIAGKLRASLKDSDQFSGKVVRDALTLQLLVKRSTPDAVFFAIESPAACKSIQDVWATNEQAFSQLRKFILVPTRAAEDESIDWCKLLGFQPDEIIPSPYSHESLFEAMLRGNAPRQETDHPSVDGEPAPVVAQASTMAGPVASQEIAS